MEKRKISTVKQQKQGLGMLKLKFKAKQIFWAGDPFTLAGRRFSGVITGSVEMANMPADREIALFARSPTQLKFGISGQSPHRLEPGFEFEFIVFPASRAIINSEKSTTGPFPSILNLRACYQCQTSVSRAQIAESMKLLLCDYQGRYQQ